MKSLYTQTSDSASFSESFYKLTIDNLTELYEMGKSKLLTAKSMLFFYLKIKLGDNPNWSVKLTAKKVKEELGIARSTFYRAMSELRAMGLINWSVPDETEFRVTLAFPNPNRKDQEPDPEPEIEPEPEPESKVKAKRKPSPKPSPKLNPKSNEIDPRIEDAEFVRWIALDWKKNFPDNQNRDIAIIEMNVRSHLNKHPEKLEGLWGVYSRHKEKKAEVERQRAEAETEKPKPVDEIEIIPLDQIIDQVSPEIREIMNRIKAIGAGSIPTAATPGKTTRSEFLKKVSQSVRQIENPFENPYDEDLEF